MKLKHRKILSIAIGLLLFAGSLIWYFFPVVAGKWFIYSNSKLLHQLNVRPSIIDKFPESPPDEWENITIDILSLSLPMHRFNKIHEISTSTSIGFISDQGAIFFPSLVPSDGLLKTLRENNINYPLMSYKDLVAEFSAIPEDVSFYKTRSENMRIYNNLILKLMAIPVSSFIDILAVNSSDLKAVCLMHETRKNGFCATLILYNQTENMTFDITFMDYKNPDMLRSDIFNILGSIKMPDQPLNEEKVKADFESIRGEYNLTEQNI